MASAAVIPEGFEIESQPAGAPSPSIPDGFEIESTPTQQASGGDLAPPAALAPVPIPPDLKQDRFVPGYMGIPADRREQIDPDAIVQGTKRNIYKFGSAAGQMMEGNAELGGSPVQVQPNGKLRYTPAPTTQQIKDFTEASDRPLVPVSEGFQPGTLEHGLWAGAESLTAPRTLATVAAAWPLSTGAALATRGWSAVGIKGLNAALGGYFTAQMAKGAWDKVSNAYDAYQKGDLDTMTDELGAGTVEGILAGLGVFHAGSQFRDISATPVPKLPETRTDVWSVGHSGSFAPPASPDVVPDLGAADTTPVPRPKQPQTIDVQAEPPAAPGSSPGEPPKPTTPPKPTESETVSPATPNPPTAAVPTAPESDATIALQMQQLGSGQRKIVMIPKGTTPPALGTYPPGTRQTSDQFGNIYVYRDDLATRSAIKRAAKNNTLHELLGSADIGMAAPDKSQLPPDAPVVTSQAPDGTEVQSTATDEQTLPATIEATQAVTPPGGKVSIQPAENVLAGRPEAQPTPPPVQSPSGDLAAPQAIEQPPAPAPPPPAPRPSQTGLDQMGGDLAGGITGNMYDMLWGKVQAGDTTEGGAPSAVLQAAKLVRDRGGMQTPEEFQVFAQEYAAIPRDKNFQQAMRDLVARYIPPPPKPEPATPVAPATTQVEAPQPPQDLVAPQSIEPTKKLEPQPAHADPLSPPGPRWSGNRGAMPGEPAYILDEDEDGNGKAALIEVETPRGVLWEARGENGEDLGTHSFIDEAAAAAEKAYPVRTPPQDLAAPQSLDQPTTQVETKPQDLVGPAPIEQPAAQPGGAVGLVNAVYQKLKAGESLGNVTELTKLAEQHFGSSRTSGNWTPKDMFDAMEAGINKYLVEVGGRLMKMDAVEGLKELRELMGRITSQGVRTEEQIKKQQFSTPPTESYLAAKVAALKPSDVVLEPSAGNGGLAAWPKSIGADVHVNEIAPRRQEMLEAAGFGKPSAHDGEILNSLLDPKIKPTVILMNPPFSAGVVKSNEGRNRNVYGFNHVDSALQRLAPGGRLVAILGGGKANEPTGGASFFGAAGRWFQKVGKQYNVRANVRISGREYQKYGTTFATRIIVIDKTGPTPTGGSPWSSVVQGNVDTLEDAYGLLRPIAESRAGTVSARPGSQTSAREGEPGAGLASGQDNGATGHPASVQGSGEPAADGELPSGPSEPDRGTRGGEPDAGNQPAPLREPESEPPANNEAEAVEDSGKRPENDDGERQVQLAGPLVLEQNTSDQIAEEDTGAYVKYQPSLKGPAHPGDIVETKTMSTVPMPALTYQTSLPPRVLEGGLSAVQLEAITIAGQQNDIVLPGGFRASALIGDGTGVGKGRISAGILYDNYLKGRKRLVWVSEKWDLMQDAMRDLTGIGAEEIMRGIKQEGGTFVAHKNPGVIGLNKFKAPDHIEHGGVLFSTYSLLRSVDKKGNRRIAQIEQYLRGADDGNGAYILFDESHNLKNAVAAGGGAKPSQIGVAVKELLQRMPNLRSVSLSATAATDVVNLGYLDRLGLWGPGTAFPNGFREFQSQVGSGGLAAMELIARELKAQGKYVSRTLSFKGTSYDETEHRLTADQKALYRTAAKAWAKVVQQAEDTIKTTTNGGGQQKARFMSLFASAQQRFFNILITTLKIPTCIELANKALDDDKSVVITLVNTNEAAQNREKNKFKDRDDDDEEEPQDYDFGPKEMLVNLVKENYPVQQWRDDVDDNGKPVKRPVYEINPVTGAEIPVNNPQAIAERDALIEEINRDLHLPENPLDILINGLGGPNEVAELTGRKEYYDRSAGKFIPRGDPNTPRKQVNILEQRAFMSGKKRVAVLSNAAGTGISLHASNTAKNTQRRFHITLQPGWSADKAMQMLGRTHRTDQASAPEYMMLISDLGGEKRFVSTISKRLGSLGALTKGQKNATGGSDLMSKVNFETTQGEQATNSFYNALLRGESVPGVDLSGHEILTDLRVMKADPQTGALTVPQEDRTNVTRLLNRLLALDPDVQNPVYDYFYDIFEAAVADAVDRGTLDTGVRELPGDDFNIKDSREIAKDPQTGAKTYYYTVDSRIRNQRINPEELEKRLDRYKNEVDEAHIRIDDEGKLVVTRNAPPIVHADGRADAASYVAGPGNGKWVKVGNGESSFRQLKKVDDWATEQRDKLTNEVKSAERSIQNYTDSIQRYGDSGGWNKREIERQGKKLETLRPQLAEAEKRAADPEDWAKEQWAHQYEAAPTHSTVEHHLIGGAVMKYWNPIKDASFIRNSIFSTTDSKTGQRVVGVQIPANRINALVGRISGGRSTVTPSQLHDDVLRNGTPYTLERNIRVRQGRVGRTTVIQLIPPNSEVAQRLTQLGAIYERGINPIYYLPNERTATGDSRAMVALTRILQEFPVKTEAPETPPQSGGSVTLGSGLGALQDPLVALYQKDIVPTAKSISRRLRGALDDLKKVFAPQTRGPLARKGAGLIREMGSELDQRRDRAVAALEGYRQHFYKDTRQEHGVYGLKVYDAIERGQLTGLSMVDRAFAAVARSLFDARKAELQELGLVKTYIDNYLPHEYKNPDEASRWIQNWQQKRPMAGSEAFRKQRTYPTLREALEDPDFTLEAKFDNPVDFVLSKLGQMDKSILAHMAFEELKDAELLKYVPAGQKIPAGSAPIDDRIFTVMGPKRGAVKFDIPPPDRSQFADDEEYENAQQAWEERMQAIDENISPRDVRVFGRREMGKYYAPEPLARVINNHLSPGISHSELYKAWRAVNNTLNMIDLSVSYYHGLTTTLNSSFSDMALGGKQLLYGKPLQAGRSIGRGLLPFASIVHDVFLGTKIQRVWDGKEQNADPLTVAIVDALKQGGGRARQDLHYATSYTSQMLKAWNEKDNSLGSSFRTFSYGALAGLEQTMKPIMEYMVPRAKLGAFAQLAQLELEKHPDMSLDEARHRFGRIWDAIDDRFGQLSQRNLMMHGTVRDLMNATVGRPGWNIGTNRTLAGGPIDALGNIADLARGRKTEVSDRTLYVLALLFGGAILNGMVNFLLTGTAPKGNDWIMPRDGGVTEDGRPSRIVLPTYVAKDLYSYFTRPLATIKGKAAPAATIASDLLTNRNFQGQKILGRGGVGVWNYAKSAVTPYAVQGLERNMERGASPARTALPFVGIMPAGKRAGLSKAEQIITDYQDEQRANTRPAPTDHTRARSQVFQAVRSGDMTKAHQVGQQAVQRGVLTPQDVQHAIQRARQTPLVNDFKTLPLNVALEVYAAATPDERKQIQAIARKKVANARAKPYEWDDESRAAASRFFGIRPPTRRGDFTAPAAIQ